MNSYNTKTITRIYFLKKRKSFYWEYHPEKTTSWFFFKTTRPEGFYNTFTIGSPKRQDECPKNHYLDDGVVYENPQLIISFTDGPSRTLYFDTLDEAIENAEELKDKSGCQWYEVK